VSGEVGLEGGGKTPEKLGETSGTVSGTDQASPTSNCSLMEDPEIHSVNLSEPRRQHSRGSSASSTLTSGTVDSDRGTAGSLPLDLGDHAQGIVVCLHRKMLPQELYFLSTEKYRPALFGIPLVVSYSINTTGQELYSWVWEQVTRLVSPLPPQDKTQHNHATDCDDSLGYEYPFVLKAVSSGGCWCSWCPWSRMCRGCSIPCTAQPLTTPSSFFAIDWDPTALHLRYLAGAEKAWAIDNSVAESRRAATEPITLGKCLEAFTQEEHLGENEKYYCSECKTHQLAVKKLQIWRLPPILIIHLKRFQNVNNKWIKSHKIVDFPVDGLDFTNYLAAVPAETLKRYKELSKRSTLISSMQAETITELNETSNPHDDPNDSGIESSNGHSTLERPSSTTSTLDRPSSTTSSRLEPDDAAAGSSFTAAGASFTAAGSSRLQRGESSGSDVFDPEPAAGGESSNAAGPPPYASGAELHAAGQPTFASYAAGAGDKLEADMSSHKHNVRTRSISTSLVQHPILDDDLMDFHGHRTKPGQNPLDVKYNMYAMVCHSGVLGGGHYVSYSKTDKGAWYCQNDSSCKEVPVGNIDKSSAYILLYEREGLNNSDYLPDLTGLKMDTGLLDEELENDFKKQCTLM